MKPVLDLLLAARGASTLAAGSTGDGPGRRDGSVR
jgi:hypothetical protein